MSQFRVGQKIETNTHRTGIVKYVGSIHVAEGFWLGIDLQEPTGKNDGSVRGERYFDCPPQHGLFVKETDILQILSQPAPKTAAPKPKAAAPAPRSRTASVVAHRPGSTRPASVVSGSTRPASVVSPPTAPKTPGHTKRQSVAPAAPRTPLRGPARKPSVASVSTAAPSPPPTRPSVTSRPSTSSVGSTQNPLKTSTRDSNVDALQTKVKHLEKQHSDDQSLLKELSQAKDERDRYHGIIQKLQLKCQTLHQESTDVKEQMKTLQSDNERLVRAEQDHEFDLEDALLEKEMAQERAEQNESELEALRAKVEERDLELEILREEAEAFTADMSEEEKEQAGYYRLQHENGRLREALMMLKEVTEEEAHRDKARIAELEEDASQLETLQTEHETVKQQLAEARGITEYLKAQVNDRNELEDVVEDMSSKMQELESRVADQDLTIRELESLRELNEELLDQQDEETKELRADFEVKDNELAELGQHALEQAVAISDLEETNSKFRDLVLELHAQIAEAESSKTMTDAQVKDTTGRINEVMDVNRRLRAAEVNATSKEITSELRQLKADQLTEMLDIWSQTQSQEFGRSEPMQAYFAAKRIVFKSSVLSNVLATADKHTNHKGGVEEASAKLPCVEATYYLANLKIGGERLSSAMASSTLPQFATFSSAYAELVAVERNLDQGLEALKTDKVNFMELAKSFGGSTEVYKAVLASHQSVLAGRPGDETMLRVRSIAASLTYLESTCAATITMLKSLVANSEDLTDEAQHVLERFTAPSAICSKGMLAATKLLKTCSDRRGDGLYPQFNGDLGSVMETEEYLMKTVRDAAKCSRNALEVLGRSVDPDGTLLEPVDLKSLLVSYWDDHTSRLDSLVLSLNSWNEYASLLKDSVEIQRGLAPWTEKAKEIEAARRQVDEAATKLQSITAEHQATLLKLHEREQVIETKELEIEHLAAKHREATSKSEDVQRLQEEIEEARTEITRLRNQDRAQQLEIEDLQNRVAHAARSESAESETAPAVATPGPDLADTGSRSAPASLMSLLDALQVENRWLRQKNHDDAFDAKQLDMFTSMRPIEKREASKLSAATNDLLSLAWLTDELEQPETLTSITKPHRDSEYTELVRSHPETLGRKPRRGPLSLTPLQTRLDPKKSSGRIDWPGMEELSFADLSPTVEYFESEMMGLRPLKSIMTA